MQDILHRYFDFIAFIVNHKLAEFYCHLIVTEQIRNFRGVEDDDNSEDDEEAEDSEDDDEFLDVDNMSYEVCYQETLSHFGS